MLSPCGSPKKWFARDYDLNDMYNVQRELFALRPSAVTDSKWGFKRNGAGCGVGLGGEKAHGNCKGTHR